MLKNLVAKNRSYRRYFNNFPVSKDLLLELIELARLTPSARNLQPLKYFISCKKETNEKIFKTLKWAGYLKAGGIDIEPEERPSGYIIVFGDRNISQDFYIDAGISAQTILLGAVEKGLGGCIVMSIDREELKTQFNFPDNLEIILVIAIGKPKEEVIIEEMKGGDVKYWRAGMTHHVPKRSLKELVINLDEL